MQLAFLCRYFWGFVSIDLFWAFSVDSELCLYTKNAPKPKSTRFIWVFIVLKVYNFIFGANFRHFLCFLFFGAQETLKMHSLIFIFILDKTYECMWLSYLQKRFKDFLCHQKIGKKAYVIMKLKIVSFIVRDNSKCTAKCNCTYWPFFVSNFP